LSPLAAASDDGDQAQGVFHDDFDCDEECGECETIDDGDFTTLLTAESSRLAAIEAERVLLLDPANCRQAINFVCECDEPCGLRSNIDADFVFRSRSALLGVPNNGSRVREVSKTLRTTRTADATLHPAAVSKGKRKVTSRATKQHFVFNNTDVCQPFYGHVLGVSDNLLSNAAVFAGDFDIDLNDKSRPLTKSTRRIFDCEDRTYVTVWFQKWAEDSGAEQLPLGDAPGFVTGVDLQGA
jgi:hypothetical protein